MDVLLWGARCGDLADNPKILVWNSLMSPCSRATCYLYPEWFQKQHAFLFPENWFAPCLSQSIGLRQNNKNWHSDTRRHFHVNALLGRDDTVAVILKHDRLQVSPQGPPKVLRMLCLFFGTCFSGRRRDCFSARLKKPLMAWNLSATYPVSLYVLLCTGAQNFAHFPMKGV